MDLSQDFWDERYKNNDIGWDLGEVSPPLKTYFDQLTNKELKIAVIKLLIFTSSGPVRKPF